MQITSHSNTSGHSRRASHTGSSQDTGIQQDVFTPGEENPMAGLSQMRRRDAGSLYGDNPGQGSEIQREDFPCMGAAFVCMACR